MRLFSQVCATARHTRLECSTFLSFLQQTTMNMCLRRFRFCLFSNIYGRCKQHSHSQFAYMEQSQCDNVAESCTRSPTNSNNVYETNEQLMLGVVCAGLPFNRLSGRLYLRARLRSGRHNNGPVSLSLSLAVLSCICDFVQLAFTDAMQFKGVLMFLWYAICNTFQTTKSAEKNPSVFCSLWQKTDDSTECWYVPEKWSNYD